MGAGNPGALRAGSQWRENSEDGREGFREARRPGPRIWAGTRRVSLGGSRVWVEKVALVQVGLQFPSSSARRLVPAQNPCGDSPLLVSSRAASGRTPHPPLLCAFPQGHPLEGNRGPGPSSPGHGRPVLVEASAVRACPRPVPSVPHARSTPLHGLPGHGRDTLEGRKPHRKRTVRPHCESKVSMRNDSPPPPGDSQARDNGNRQPAHPGTGTFPRM